MDDRSARARSRCRRALGRKACLGISAGLLAGLLVAGPSLVAAQSSSSTRAVQAQQEIPEELLLDVGIEIFDPGLPEAATPLEPETVPDVRKSEARYIPVRLMETLQTTGQWGAVRVLSPAAGTLDVRVSGTLISSTGARLVLEIRVEDSRRQEWFDRRYKQEADPRSYGDEAIPRDPFQDLYNEIANDLVAARNKLDEDEILELRTISELRFAADLAPAAFGDYLGRDRKGRYTAERLPAEDDPMMERVARIRERDNLFIDTLSEYYAAFQARMERPYSDWRSFAYEEEMARRKLKRQARARKVLGAVSILAGVMAPSDSRAGRAAGDAAVIGGVIAVQSGVAKGQEAKIHTEALRELASSLDAEVEPLLVEMEGQTLRLEGSMETQYATWRELLRDLLAAETGLPLDPDTGEPLELPAPVETPSSEAPLDEGG